MTVAPGKEQLRLLSWAAPVPSLASLTSSPTYVFQDWDMICHLPTLRNNHSILAPTMHRLAALKENWRKVESLTRGFLTFFRELIIISPVLVGKTIAIAAVPRMVTLREMSRYRWVSSQILRITIWPSFDASQVLLVLLIFHLALMITC